MSSRASPSSPVPRPGGGRHRNRSTQPLLAFFDAEAPRPAAPPEARALPALGDLVLPPPPPPPSPPTPVPARNGFSAHGPSLPLSAPASGEKAKALDILDALRTLQEVERERRLPVREERRVLARFGGFGPVALSLFPDPVTGQYKSPAWGALGADLVALLPAEEYESARRTVFNAFYTSPVVVAAMFEALGRLGVPEGATVLEPGCGSGNFMALAPAGMKFLGVELDRVSGRIARALHPGHDIRIENFRDTRLPEGSFDAVIGNPPFADVKFEHAGMRLSLHDFFVAKSLDALKPGGILALVTTHYSLDKQNAQVRDHLSSRADFLGAIRLPSDAFRAEGTSVVTDILFLRRRPPGEAPRHADPAWLEVGILAIEGAMVAVNRYFLERPEMVLGRWSRKDRLYGGGHGYSVTANGDLAGQLRAAIGRLPRGEPLAPAPRPGPATFAPAPPPGLDHIAEGSFYLGPGRAIHQVTGGQSAPVTYGGTRLNADGSLVGRRLAALIELRDRARNVLKSQNDGRPEPERIEARRLLNRSYARFASTYGPVNKTTFSETDGGTTIRRMPNLVKFREDPDAMLVMSLEHYDEATGHAAPAAIMLKDVVGKSPPVVSVRSAEEGLLVSLDHKGTVDVAYIARLYGVAEAQAIRELGDLIYRDPATSAWETADAYLSGEVRSKLARAQDAGPDYARNAEALRAVQPEDVLPGDIDANLGAPWIPVPDVEAFAAHLFGVGPGSVRVGHLAKDAVWSIDFDFQVERTVAATAEYGTARANGTWLLELALNLKTPLIQDTLPGGDARVVNQDETLAAREKQKLIKDRFRSWAFADPDRTERLVRIYNDTYNNLRPRLFDGSHLDFPGMNRTVTLDRHQEDAVWRAMSGGNTLLAHAVGAGKTFTMAASGMKMRAAGLLKKPMYVVPNHMLEQFAREFMQLYPNARLLVATKDDLARERRKVLTAKIASGEWDGIIVTHSSFERVGMSRDYQARFLRGQIAEYDELLRDSARGDAARNHRNLIKTIEKQKARREARLKELLAEDKKDDGLVFDELGVDHLFVDEAHYFKNLETPTKMERVAGIQAGGSERAFDLFMKARHLHEAHAGHGLVFATGTPISNTMVEMYTMQRFLDLDGLARRGIDHFDAWAATFGEVVDTMEISPDGASLRPRSRFARFINLPELQQMFRAFADVQTAEMLDLPRPGLAGGKPAVVACPMSGAQRAIQQDLVRRYERIRSQKVDPREDNALAITTDGRKLALDARLVAADARDFPDSKLNAAVAHIGAIWRETSERRSTQLVFCDMGVHPTPWGYSAYGDLIAKLVVGGIPRDQVAAIGDADTDAKTQVLFEKVRNGTVRVLIGSTQKMGTGTNVQRRLVALHHLDAPWKPAEVEQREGRILRQGNQNEEVRIFRYVTEGSFDAYMWQALETKARFIAQVITGESAARRAEDIGGQELSYAEVKAIASGNPAVLTLAEADAELQRLSTLRKHHADEQFLARRNLRDLPEAIARQATRLAAHAADLATLATHADDPVIIGDRPCRRDEVQAALGRRLESVPELVSRTRRHPLGIYRGLGFGLVIHPEAGPEVYLEGAAVRHAGLSRDSHGPRAVLNALERLAASTEAQRAAARDELALAEGQLRDYRARLGRPFRHDAYQAELATLRDRLKVALSASDPKPGKEPRPSAAELAEQVRALKDSQEIDATPQPARGAPRTATGERPVTARIRERREASLPDSSEEERREGPKEEVSAVEEAPPSPAMHGTPAGAAPSAATPTGPRPAGAPASPKERKRQGRLF